MIGSIRIALGLSVAAVTTFPMAAVQLAVLKLGLGREGYLPGLWHRLVIKILGFRMHVVGQPATGRPLLIAANHISWTDIMVVGAVADVHFVAKSEMGGWPIIGKLSRLQRTIYVERERRPTSGKQVSEIGQRLSEGDAMVFFAEGSTSDGNLMQPFKSTLFGAAQIALRESGTEQVLVQPVAIVYTRLHGIPMGRFMRPHAAWIGDRALVPHILQLLADGGVDVEVHFGEPIPFLSGSDRKDLARTVQARVRDMMATALRNPIKSR